MSQQQQAEIVPPITPTAETDRLVKETEEPSEEPQRERRRSIVENVLEEIQEIATAINDKANEVTERIVDKVEGAIEAVDDYLFIDHSEKKNKQSEAVAKGTTAE